MSEKSWPLRIFISSVMLNEKEPEREKILKIRSSLYQSLDAYFFLAPYKLEQEDSSVLNLKTTYLSRLRNSDLVVFLLDSHFSIPDGVREEISTARQENISRDYFIIPGLSGESKSMKDELLQQGESNFINVLPESEDYTSIIANAILGQLVNVFQAYSNHSLVSVDDNLTNLNSQSLSATALSAEFSKEMFNSVGISKQYVRNLVFHWNYNNEILEPQSGVDQAIIAMLKRLYSNTSLPFAWDSMLLASIEEAAETIPHEMLYVMQQRSKAVKLYFSEKFDQASAILSDILKSKEIEKVPSWVVQDILIDLRNLMSLKDEYNNTFRIENEYQTQLNNFSIPFHYPGIDRSISTVQNWVLIERTKHETSSSDIQNMYGSGIKRYTDALTDALILACCNGSITQIRQLPKNLNILSEMFLQHFEKRIYLVDVIQNKLLMGTPYSKVEGLLTRYSFLHGQFTDNDSMSIINRVKAYPNHIGYLAVAATALRIFGDYLSDEHFQQCWSELFTQIKCWSEAEPLVTHPAIEILGLLRNCYRIPQDDLISIIAILSDRALRYRDDIADVIYGAIDHKNWI